MMTHIHIHLTPIRMGNRCFMCITNTGRFFKTQILAIQVGVHVHGCKDDNNKYFCLTTCWSHMTLVPHDSRHDVVELRLADGEAMKRFGHNDGLCWGASWCHLYTTLILTQPCQEKVATKSRTQRHRAHRPAH